MKSKANIYNKTAQEKEKQTEGEWEEYNDTLKCSRCGFGYFPGAYYFRNNECISAGGDRFYFKFCPDCGKKMTTNKADSQKSC